MGTQCSPPASLPGAAWSWGTGRSSYCTALSRASGAKVGVPQGHFDGAVAHQLLDDLERDTPHGEVAAVGVA